MEGVMMRGATSMAMAVRNPDGDIVVETQRLKPKKKIRRVPIIRGILAFCESMVVGVRCITRSAEASVGDDQEIGKGMMGMAVVIAMVLAVGLFFVLPMFFGTLMRKAYDSVLFESLMAGLMRLVIFIGYMLLVSLLKDIRRTYMYHGAEHKTINCYEKGLELNVANVQSCSTRHNRCGTTFLFIVMVISIVLFSIVNWLLDLIFGGVLQGAARFFVYVAIKLLLLPLVAGISYEILQGVAKLPDNIFAKILRAPGLALQAFTTRQPDDEMVAVAIAAFENVLEMDANPTIAPRSFDEISLKEAATYMMTELNELGAETAEGAWLLCAVTGKRRSELGTLRTITTKQFKQLKEYLEKRKTMPLDYVLGVSSFFGRDIKVDSRVLIPRMETELLAEQAIREIGDLRPEVLDLCTGSGCIALTLARETEAIITAADVSEEALQVAAQNLENTDVELVESDMFSGLSGRLFDIIVCNPPYIASDVIDTLAMEVQVQPRIALDGGEDGLYFYRKIATHAADYLKRGGRLLLEIGYDQAEQVKRMLSVIGGFKDVRIIKDLDGNDRIIRAAL